MKLWRGGFGDVWYYTVANEKHEAIVNIQEKYRMFALPVVAELVDDIDGFKIIATKEVPKVEPEVIKIVCKNCNEEFENRGQLLAHSKKCGK